MNEMLLLWLALIAYVIAGSAAIFSVVWRKRPHKTALGLMLLGLVLHTASLALRWNRIGHGPFVTMFEILSSNIWSLMLAYTIAFWRLPVVRASAAIVMPILFVMMGWLLMTNPGEAHLPPTYHTIWLFIHIGFGKVFLGAMLVAVGVSGIILSRRTDFGRSRFERLPSDERLDDLAYRCMALGFIFESLMLVAGAIWAQDAWGRYWAWDPLETWAFLTWLCLALSIHARLTYRLSPRANSLIVMAVFGVAFLTFFGVPFISQSAHKGAV